LNHKQILPSPVVALTEQYIREEFDCGKHKSLSEWLKRHSLEAERVRSARTYITHRENRVVGYYSLCAASVSKEEASARVAKYQPGYPIPVILLARLAVDKSYQGKGLGSALLKDALYRSFEGSKLVGARAILVHTVDKEAKQFYKHFGFEDCPVNDLHMMLLIKDLERSLKV
jgi:predicted N-acetyltransferase YhbS